MHVSRHTPSWDLLQKGVKGENKEGGRGEVRKEQMTVGHLGKLNLWILSLFWHDS